MAAQGAILSLAARRKDKLDQLVEEIEQAGGKARAFTTDVRKREDLEALVTSTISAFGRIDVLFNNAGVMPLSMLENLQYEQWEQMLDK